MLEFLLFFTTAAHVLWMLYFWEEPLFNNCVILIYITSNPDMQFLADVKYENIFFFCVCVCEHSFSFSDRLFSKTQHPHVKLNY